ncbi:hypothetical protein AMS58_19215 [Pseudoalteromonas porphyrae]|uniref:Uncharacterized protein n=2 Tax=Pseudoalteromonas TaxID=53246 RepID=A0A0N1EMF7_9GAMM|nr:MULTISPECIES: hypothetical protein [Pseudoalteromonas]KPH65062.1 hypothetical protein ADS77_01950 [Pseudoalteromonas porphyrae]KPH93061.1 hypothetical protein AMS58_19215 [Pseudoalteromonas porphyrae]NMR27882.1 hypothetical protein [Pseudoalteromonas sp. NEC-BIFX-2020_015]NNG44198.1 hypothetical protein [Pseudoalteromonas sp. NEC-BIFX-2020_002]
MPVSAEQVTEQLIALKCRSNFKIKNITEFMLPSSKEAIYLHIEGGQPKIVIRPAFEVFSDDFSALDGVSRISDVFHNNEMTRFPTRIYKSANPIHYGVAFKIGTEKSAKEFIELLLKIMNG